MLEKCGITREYPQNRGGTRYTLKSIGLGCRGPKRKERIPKSNLNNETILFGHPEEGRPDSRRLLGQCLQAAAAPFSEEQG